MLPLPEAWLAAHELVQLLLPRVLAQVANEQCVAGHVVPCIVERPPTLGQQVGAARQGWCCCHPRVVGVHDGLWCGVEHVGKGQAQAGGNQGLSAGLEVVEQGQLLGAIDGQVLL